MSITVDRALELVPEGAPNRELLARLLTDVEETRSALERDTVQRTFHAHMRNVAALVLLADSTEQRTPEGNKARRALFTAADTARVFARRNKLHPSTHRGVVEEARLMLGTLR